MKKLPVVPLLILVLFPIGQFLYADAIDDIKAGEWYEVPNSHMNE